MISLNEKLRDAQTGYDYGDYANVKIIISEIFADKDVTDGQKEKALKIKAAIGIDPVAYVVFGFSFLTIIIITINHLF